MHVTGPDRPASAMARLTEAERLRIVHLSSEGLTLKRIAAKVGCSEKTVRFWLHAYQARRSARSKKGAGRPKLLVATASKRAVQLLLEGSAGGARFVARKLRSEDLTDRVVSAGTVLRAAKAQAQEDGDPLICRRGRPPKGQADPARRWSTRRLMPILRDAGGRNSGEPTRPARPCFARRGRYAMNDGVRQEAHLFREPRNVD